MELYRSDSRAPWYTSRWFVLVVLAIVVLLIAWSISGRSPSRIEQQAQGPSPAEVGPSQDQSRPQASPSDQPARGSRRADLAVPL